MKRITLALTLLVGFLLPLAAQDTDAGATANTASEAGPAPGPGQSLPPNSQEMEEPNFEGLLQNATGVADSLCTQTGDLMELLAILALIWTGYHAQFRGLEEFIGTLLRIALAAAILSQYKDIAHALFESRDELAASLSSSLSTVGLVGQFGTLIATVTAGAFLMGPAGVALVGLVLIAVAMIYLVFIGQHLFEAILVAFGPLAVACMAFRHTSGIFSFWLKTLVAVLLVPVGWMLALKLGQNIFAAGKRAHAVNDLVSGVLYTLMSALIYAGMPFLIVSIVNHTSGAAAAAMPSILASAQAFFGARGMMGGGVGRLLAGGGGGAALPAMSTTLTSSGRGGEVSRISTTFSTPAGATPSSQPSLYAGELARAQGIHRQMAAQLHKPS